LQAIHLRFPKISGIDAWSILQLTAEDAMNSLRKFGFMLVSAMGLFAGAAQTASAQSGYYDDPYYNNPYNRSAYDDRYYDDRGYRGATIRCESRNQRTTYCRIGGRGGDVRLVNQMSQNACIRGRTWGVSGDRIWVTRGCRGQFRLGDYYGRNDRYRDDRYYDRPGYGYGYGGGPARTVVCESRDGRYNFCRGFGYVDQVQIRRQLSNARCLLNSSWGYRNDGIWVDRGCRAEFILY
jgi:hypothetical protein